MLNKVGDIFEYRYLPSQIIKKSLRARKPKGKTG
jgi:hypothetical protein